MPSRVREKLHDHSCRRYGGGVWKQRKHICISTMVSGLHWTFVHHSILSNPARGAVRTTERTKTMALQRSLLFRRRITRRVGSLYPVESDERAGTLADA